MSLRISDTAPDFAADTTEGYMAGLAGGFA